MLSGQLGDGAIISLSLVPSLVLIMMILFLFFKIRKAGNCQSIPLTTFQNSNNVPEDDESKMITILHNSIINNYFLFFSHDNGQ
jgi:hypothetical protein